MSQGEGRCRRVSVVSSGQLSTCPRMVKTIDALHDAGYAVRAVTNRRAEWAVDADRLLLAERTWLRHVRVDTTRAAGLVSFLPAAIGQGIARRITQGIGVSSSSSALRARALVRSYSAMASAILAEPTDLVYACGGSFPVVAVVAQAAGLVYAVDFEDLHSGQFGSADEAIEPVLTRSLERDAASRASFVTLGSPEIARIYRERLMIEGRVIHNVFPVGQAQAVPRGVADDPPVPLRVCWFSQTVGPGRGLEQAIRAAGRCGVPMELALRGRVGAFRDELERLAAHVAPHLQLNWQAPVAPVELVSACRAFDVGLCLEPGDTENSKALLSNKLFTYLAAGLAIVFSDTPAQRGFHERTGASQALVPIADPQALASVFTNWDRDRLALKRAQEQSLCLARERWHWEHPLERGSLLELFDRSLKRARRSAS